MTTETSMQNASTSTSVSPVWYWVPVPIPRIPMAMNEPKVASMKMSAWAKLISRSTP